MAASGGRDVCPRCGEQFGCAIASGNCWCAQVPLDGQRLAEIADGYEGCLCPACLRELAATLKVR